MSIHTQYQSRLRANNLCDGSEIVSNVFLQLLRRIVFLRLVFFFFLLVIRIAGYDEFRYFKNLKQKRQQKNENKYVKFYVLQSNCFNNRVYSITTFRRRGRVWT